MGSTTIPARSNNQTIDQNWFNLLQQAVSTDVVPRNSSGVATDSAGSLGSSTYQWLKAFIASGYWDCGDVKIHHNYAGAVPVGQGWMLCDGRQVTQANYDAEHGSGSWAKYVGTSPLAGRYLPSMQDMLPMGKLSLSQDGSTFITSIGATGNHINLQHSHTVNSHTHDMGNHTHSISPTSGQVTPGGGADASPSSTGGPSTNNTGSASPGTNNQLSNQTDITPASIEFLYYMRII